jgi:hypothetical protein
MRIVYINTGSGNASVTNLEPFEGVLATVGSEMWLQK